MQSLPPQQHSESYLAYGTRLHSVFEQLLIVPKNPVAFEVARENGYNLVTVRPTFVSTPSEPRSPFLTAVIILSTIAVVLFLVLVILTSSAQPAGQ